jgi:hypothetical protein
VQKFYDYLEANFLMAIQTYVYNSINTE